MFCSEDCIQKNIRDQIIEGLLDGDAVEHLLREKDLTLDKAITTCRAQEAAKKQRAEISNTSSEPAYVQTLHRQSNLTRPPLGRSCPGCGGGLHNGAAHAVQPTTTHATYVRRLATLQECVEDRDHHRCNHNIPLPLHHKPLPRQEHGLFLPHH